MSATRKRQATRQSAAREKNSMVTTFASRTLPSGTRTSVGPTRTWRPRPRRRARRSSTETHTRGVWATEADTPNYRVRVAVAVAAIIPVAAAVAVADVVAPAETGPSRTVLHAWLSFCRVLTRVGRHLDLVVGIVTDIVAGIARGIVVGVGGRNGDGAAEVRIRPGTRIGSQRSLVKRATARRRQSKQHCSACRPVLAVSLAASNYREPYRAAPVLERLVRCHWRPSAEYKRSPLTDSNLSTNLMSKPGREQGDGHVRFCERESADDCDSKTRAFLLLRIVRSPEEHRNRNWCSTLVLHRGPRGEAKPAASGRRRRKQTGRRSISP
jgi:hypothetical protein